VSRVRHLLDRNCPYLINQSVSDRDLQRRRRPAKGLRPTAHAQDEAEYPWQHISVTRQYCIDCRRGKTSEGIQEIKVIGWRQWRFTSPIGKLWNCGFCIFHLVSCIRTIDLIISWSSNIYFPFWNMKARSRLGDIILPSSSESNEKDG
jgi:hypothetical protein